LKGVLNQYTIRAVAPILLRRFHSTTITFSTDTGLDLPEPRYLALHAACAKFIHLSGAGDYIKRHYEEMEVRRELATDGSTAALLVDALLRKSDIA
jgi:hypothetical protein